MKNQIVLLLLTLLPMFARADDSGSCGVNVKYTYVEATHTLTISGSGAMKNYSYYISAPWYNYRSSIMNVIVEDGVTSIGDAAFSGCRGLTSVTIPNSVTNIGYETFDDCSSLTSVTIPNSVTSIGVSAFSGCSGLTSVTIPNSVTSIGERAFSGCIGLTSITIPNSVMSIGIYAFYGCIGLTSITIPNSVTNIGGNAFENTGWYNNQPDGVVYAGKCAYKYKGVMPANTIIILNEGTIGIAGDAFWGCSGLISITIPNSVKSIGGTAFSYCSGLTSITIPNSVTSIGYNAFYNCRGLTSITIPNSVTSIGGSAFGNTGWYNNQPDGVVYAGKCAYNYKGVMPANTIIILNEGTTGIANSAFINCRGLTSIKIPNSVTNIGSTAFSYCSGLTSITIPNSVSSIEYQAFEGCSGLTSITIPNSVTSIGEGAFRDCSSLNSITIPNSVTSIGGMAFYGCTNLLTVNSEITELFDCSYVFAEETQRKGVLYIPAGTMDLYTIFDGWREFFKIKEVAPSAVRAAQSQAEIKVVSDGVVISNAEPDTRCIIYQTDGKQVVNTVISEGTRKITLHQGQAYIMNINGRTLKFAM